jgi:S-adenosylmethionine-diacylglycerol 3-amino-3-carboxypropyl transferase
MRDQAITVSGAADSRSPLKRAAVRSSKASRDGMLERLFAFAFDGLVYPQIWEDPAVDMAAMDIQPDHHIVAITSGGCNVMSYLTADPARITAVDLNIAHLSLLELKLKAARHLPSHSDFARFFADANSPLNPELYDLFIEPHLSSEARTYWSTKRQFGGRRIDLFAKGFYKVGLLGRFISLAHAAARLYGVNPAEIMSAKTLDEQRWFFAEKLEPLFDKRLIRWLTSSPVSLYGLGIPPAQYAGLAGSRHMADVLKERLGALACDHSLSDNYFARQAFGRSYADPAGKAKLPPYLDTGELEARCARLRRRVRTAKNPVTDVLEAHPENSCGPRGVCWMRKTGWTRTRSTPCGPPSPMRGEAGRARHFQDRCGGVAAGGRRSMRRSWSAGAITASARGNSVPMTARPSTAAFTCTSCADVC